MLRKIELWFYERRVQKLRRLRAHKLKPKLVIPQTDQSD